MKLFKPIYPAKDLNYSPTYKNPYNRIAPGFAVVYQYFGENKSDFYANAGMKGHNGLDLPCLEGTPVFAAHDGTVIKLSTQPTYGLGVTIESSDGMYKTIYWHLKEIKCVVGQQVKALDLIGLADSTGQSTGNHLHFGYYPADEPKDNGYDGAVDPLPYIIETPQFTFNNNLWLGKSGEEIKNLQIALAYEGFLGQVGFPGFTGYFGKMTFEAVKQFQRKYGIWATGFVGNLTRSKLNEIK